MNHIAISGSKNPEHLSVFYPDYAPVGEGVELESNGKIIIRKQKYLNNITRIGLNIEKQYNTLTFFYMSDRIKNRNYSM